jgi:type I restriction enzyme, S subunit
MAGRYQAYQEYKDSGIDMIGYIPSDWQTASISKLFHIIAGGDVKTQFFSNNQTEEHPYPIYTNANDEKAVYGYTSKSNYPSNSITVSGRGDVGFAIYRDHQYDAIIRLLVLIPQKDYSCKFFTYFINNVLDFRVESSAIGQLSTLQISPYKVAFPISSEQHQIANFLDHETAKIDTLIEKQQRLISLLKEKRQAVISHAVTKGLNPDAPMKNSGVDMLGKIPQHWDTRVVRYLLQDGSKGIKIGPFGSALKLEEMVDSGIRVYGQENVIWRDFTVGDRRITSQKYKDMQVYTTAPGDLLVTMMGTSGKCAIVPKNAEIGIIDSHLLRLRVKNIVIPRFFRLLLDECYEIKSQVEVAGKGSIMHGLNSGIVKGLSLPLPPVKEQVSILDFLDHETAKIDTLIEKAQHSIDLSKERRTALISAAVTGKIDVRNWQPPSNDGNVQ